MNSPTIWIISEIYYPIKTSTGYYMTEIAEYLAARGMDVHVICTASIYNKGETGSLLKNEVQNGVYIHRVLSTNADKNHFIKRVFRLFYSSIKIFFKTLSLIKRNDKILVVTNPAFLLLFMPYVKWRKKIKYWILVHDIFPENLVAIKKMKSCSLSYNWLKSIFDKVYSKASGCISIGRDMSEVLERKIGLKTPIILIPSWAENDTVYPKEKSNTRLFQTLGLKNKFIFQFAGNLGYAQGLDNILAAINLVDNSDIHFLFIGGGAKYEKIKEFSERHNNVSLVDFMDRSEQNNFLNACDVAIITLGDGMYGLGVPSKSYNIMAAGKPILMIGEPQTEIALCIEEYSLGWNVRPDDPVALKKVIEEIYAEKEHLSHIRNNARRVAENVFAKDIILDKYYQLLN